MSTDVAVVGAGLMGAATAWACTRRGLSVTVLEQFPLGHSRGSSHGSARIFRRAYPDPFWIRLTGRARELWDELEADTGTTLLRITGGLDHGTGRNVHAIAAGLADAAIAHELLPAAEAGRRWPGLAFATDVLHHPEAGVIDAAAATTAMLDAARSRGARVLADVPVRGLGTGHDAVVLRTDGEPLRARRVVVAAGAWVTDLAGPVAPFEISQQQTFHFRREDPSAPWPTFVHKYRLNVYGLPGGADTGPIEAIKLGEHGGGSRTTAATRTGVVDPAARDRMVEHVRRWLPGLVPEPFAEATCLYTSTASTDFVLDRSGPVIVCSPCSGHGAKFAPLIGELAADLVLGAAPEPRFALRAAA